MNGMNIRGRIARSIACCAAAIWILCLPNPSGAQVSCPRLLDGPPRGVMCLHCMHPAAGGRADPFVEILLSSCLKNVAIAFVTDGSFDYDENIILDAIERLGSGGRTLYLHLYVYNGAAQRRWRTRFFRSFAVMDPAAFRVRIRGDRRLRRKFTAELVKLRPILEAARSAGARVSLAPAIEDNLDNSGFSAAIKLIRRGIPRKLLPSLVRSPCGDCAFGNQSGIPAGIRSEVHTLSTEFSTSGGIISTDGEYFVLDHDMGPGVPAGTPTLTSIVPTLQRAGALRNVFLLWVPKFQATNPDFSPVHPDTRDYKTPTPRDKVAIIEFLRRGL